MDTVKYDPKCVFCFGSGWVKVEMRGYEPCGCGVEEAPPVPATGYPDGNPKTAAGAKKPDLSLIPPSAKLHLAAAMMEGAKKYGAFNWRENAVNYRTYIAAAERHLGQFLDGEDFDPQSNAHHLGHVMACCAIVLDCMEQGNAIDNRPMAGKAGVLVRRFDETGRLAA